MLMISLEDNGRGFDKEMDISQLASDGHYGLLGISERMAIMGGRMHLQPQPAGGSMLIVEIPHPRVKLNLEPGD